MKIVRTKEDITDDIWCPATEENFNALKKLGIKSFYESWYDIRNDSCFLYTDVFVISYKQNNFLTWRNYKDREGIEFRFEPSFKEDLQNFSLSRLGFLTPETFKAEIFKIYNDSKETFYIGVVNDNIPAKWTSVGICINPGKGYSLYKEYKQKIYTKLNSPGFNPKQKFKVSWTENMSKGLEESGWKLATNEEIEKFKNTNKKETKWNGMKNYTTNLVKK